MPPKLVGFSAAGAVALAVWACQPAGVAPFPTETDQFASGGDATVYDATSAAFSLAAANLSTAHALRHGATDRAFEAQFVSAPAPVNPGLGPVFNNNSCAACHAHDGGGQPPKDGGASMTMLFRLSVPGQAADGGPVAVPGFGLQLQDHATFGVTPEAQVTTHYTAVPGTYADGTAYTLKQPTYTLSNPYTPMPDGVLVSPRLTPAVYGLGLLEAVPEAQLLALADETDRDGDGISGRPNYVWDTATGAQKLGRFGWKANTPTLRQQVAAAYQQDMGITSSFYPSEASMGQPQAPQAGKPDLPDGTLDDAVYYVQTVGVPARRGVADPTVRRGAALFKQAQCAACHAPSLTTGAYDAAPELAYQVIHPYTDLLLHDMGDALADHRPDFRASGSEWRTAPLWGIGLRKRVEGAEPMLHDGRASGVAEAILWHGGEAERAKQAFRAMSQDERAALLAFVNSL